MKIKLKTQLRKMLSDTHTPVGLYLKLRDQYPHSLLLESADFKEKQNNFSYLCLQPIASFSVGNDLTKIQFPNGEERVESTIKIKIEEELQKFIQSFDCDKPSKEFITNGIFGYTSYDGIPLFENIKFKNKNTQYPLIQYHFYRFLIVFNHFNNELYLVEHLLEHEFSEIEKLEELISNRAISSFNFNKENEESSNFTDENFLKQIVEAQQYCFFGDVFQLVLSRKFHQKFTGDEFNVYRALRSINPSPYLFYFDYGSFKIFGSSPEAQLTISNQQAFIHPIAGTFKRSGDLQTDKKLAEQLSNDPKENAEHVMLVDLARNDLSKNSKSVEVEYFKEVEFYSHVIHLVSKVKSLLPVNYNPLKIFTDTFPAGTLSGAPKYRAMEIIDDLEPENRGFYGGAIGFIGFDGTLNHAIFIRSLVSKNNILTYQAGCGIVTKSDIYSELQEVNNKLSAVRSAINFAQTL